MLSTFVGCQPIYTADLSVHAFELLFRSGDRNEARFDDGDRATAELIMNVFTAVGLDTLVGDRPAFINVTRNFILDGHAMSLPPDRIVLEILEDIRPDPEIIEALRSLSSQGYTIALDDFVYSPQMEPLVSLADIVKVELPAIPREDLPRHVDMLRRSRAKLLAEKIETHEEFENCRQLGFDYYQGYFLSKPRVVVGRQISPNRIAMLQLVNQLSDPAVCVDGLVKTIGADPSLCYKLLKYANSASTGNSRPIDSLSAAVTLIGARRLQSFTTLALFASANDAKPIQLIITALARGRMCELLAIAQRNSRPDMYFLAGLFSMMDVLLDQPIRDALNAVPLAPAIIQAILDADGPLADILTCAVNYEMGNWDCVSLPNVDADSIRSAYIESLQWARSSAETASHQE
ncbi:MAG: HDOD domain-containing protein [Planctomycetaceae bacterium]